MRRIGVVLAVVLLGLCQVAMPAAAQDVFSSGDGEGGGGDTFSSGGGEGGDQYNGSGGGDCGGINMMVVDGRCVPRPLPGLVGCQPYYNNYPYFVQTMMQHLQVCEMRGNQVWCHALKGGTCNPELGGSMEYPLVDTGTRFTPDCRQVCGLGGGGGGNDDGGQKALKRVPRSPNDGGPGSASDPGPGPDGYGPRLLAALSSCFTPPDGFSPLPYYHAPKMELRASNPQFPQAVIYFSGTVTIDPKVLGRQSKQTQVFLIAKAVAEHAQTLHAQAYAVPGNTGHDPDDHDTIIGFLDRCLMDKGHVEVPKNLSPRNPRILYGAFAKADWRSSEQVADFAYGFQSWPLVPTSLLSR